MSFVLQYPGNARLDAVAGRMEIVGTGPSVETANSILDDLVGAWDSGLNFNGTIQAIQLYIRAAGYATPSPSLAVNATRGPGADFCRLAERSLSIARSTWAPFTGLLSARDAIAAWQALDGLYAAIISGHLHEDVLMAGFRNIETAEYPQSATASFIVRRMLTLGIVDSRLVTLIEYLRSNSRFPQEMALVSAVGARLDYELLAQSLKRSGAAIEAMAAMRALDESVSDTFGGEFFVDVTGGDNRQAGDMLTKRALAARAEWNISDPFLDSYVEYLIGRIEAGAGNPEHALRVFEKTFRNGFAPFDSTIYMAYLATSLGDRDTARAAVENLVSTHAIPAGFEEAFGAAANAYRRAGGDTARLERVFPMERLVDECRKNRARIDQEFEDGMESRRGPAVMRFWRGKAETLLAGVGKVLQPSDFDAGRHDRHVSLPASLMVKACVDQLPGLSPIARQVFFEAGKGGAPVSEVVGLITEIAGQFEMGFDEMARLVPAWAFSSSVAVGRLEDALKSRNESAVDLILDQYIDLEGVPSGLLAELYGRVTGGDCCLVNREKVLLMGVRLWRASRGGSGARILKTIRQMAFEMLGDEGAKGLWITALDAILDTIPDDDTRKAMCDWFMGAADRQTGNRADPMLLNAGMILGRRIGTPFNETVRARLRDLVLAGDNREPESLRPADLSARIVRLNQWCEGDPDADRLISDWFHRWVRVQGMKAPSNWEAITDIAGLAINRTGDDEARVAVASTALRVLKSRLTQAGGGHRVKDRVLAKIEGLADVLPEASELVADWRERTRVTRLRVSVGAALVAAVAATAVLLILLYSC